MRRLLVILICLLIATAVYADYPLPEVTPITLENAADLQHLASVGGDLPGQLAWSPDGTLLAAGMTSAVKIYAADDLNAPSLVLAGGIDVMFDPTSQRLVSGGQLWDVESGEALADLGTYNTHSTFSPSGNILVTGQQVDGKTVVSLWSSDGERLIDLNTDSDSIFSGAVFNAAENQIALLLENVNPFRASPLGVVQVWDVTSGQQMAVLESGFEDVMKVQFVVDDRLLLVQSMSSAIYGGPLGDIRLWDVQTGELVDQWNDVYFPVISPDGNMMIEGDTYCCEGRELQIFYLARSTAQSFGSSNNQPAFSPDGHYFAVIEGRAGSRGKLPAKQTEAESHILLRPFNDEGFFSEPSIRIPLYTYLDNMYRFSPDSRLLAVHIQGGIEIWDLQTQTIQKTIETSLSFSDFTFSPDGQYIVAFSGGYAQSGAATLYEIASGQVLGTLPTNSIRNPQFTQSAYWENGDVHVVNGLSSTDTLLPAVPSFMGSPTVISPVSGRAIFKGEKLNLVDLLSGRPMTRFNGVEAAFTPDGQRLLIDNGTVSIRDFSVSSSNPGIVNDVRAYVRGSALNADGSLMAFSGWGDNNNLHLFSLKNGDEVASWNLPSERPLTQAFSPSGRVLVTATDDWRSTLISLWDVDEALRLGGGENLKPLAIFETWGSMSGSVWTRFSPDGKYLALLVDHRELGDGPSASEYRLTLLKVDELIQRGGEMGEDDLNPVVIEGMYQPQFSPDGRYLLTTQYAGIWDEADTLVLWDVNTGTQIAAVEGGEAAAFSPDGTLIATQQTDGIALYDVMAVVAGETQPVTVLPYLNNLYEIVFSADSTLLFARTIRSVETWGIPAN